MMCLLILTLIVVMACLTREFCSSPVTHCSAEFKGLQFNLFWSLGFFLCPKLLTKRITSLCCSTTEFKMYFLLLTIKSFLFLQVTQKYMDVEQRFETHFSFGFCLILGENFRYFHVDQVLFSYPFVPCSFIDISGTCYLLTL